MLQRQLSSSHQLLHLLAIPTENLNVRGAVENELPIVQPIVEHFFLHITDTLMEEQEHVLSLLSW